MSEPPNGHLPGYYNRGMEMEGDDEKDEDGRSEYSLGSEIDLGTIPTESDPWWKRAYCTTTDGGHMLATLYTLILIVLGVGFPIREALQETWLTTYVEAFFLMYLYGMSCAFILFVDIYLIQMDRKHGHEKKAKEKPQILVKDTNRNSSSIYDTVNGKFSAVDNQSLAKRRQSMVEAGRGVEIYILEPPTDHELPHKTGLYVRFGTVIFGLGNMVYNGLVLRKLHKNIHNANACMETTFVWPYYVNLAFLILQTYFIFKHHEVHITFVKPLARVGFMHLFATNVCVWIRTVIRETLDGFMHHGAGHGDDGYGAAAAEDHGDSGSHGSVGYAAAGQDHYIATTYPSYNVTNGTYLDHGCTIAADILDKAAPYLFPCVLEYSLLAAAVMFSMYDDVGMESASEIDNTPALLNPTPQATNQKDDSNKTDAFTTTINFSKSHKGMFAGILMIAGTMVSGVLFYAYSEGMDEDLFIQQLIYHVTIITLYSAVFIVTLMAFIQLHPMKFAHKASRSVDDVMLGVAVAGFSLFQLLKIIPLVSVMQNPEEEVPLNGGLQLGECCLAAVAGLIQTFFLIDGMRRSSKTEEQFERKPGRGAVMFLLLTNVALWLFRTINMKEIELTGKLQEKEYGYLAWQLILHALVPLLIFYHFHCSACFAHIWSHAYENPPPEPEKPKGLKDDSDEDDDDDDGGYGLPMNGIVPRRTSNIQPRSYPQRMTDADESDTDSHTIIPSISITIDSHPDSQLESTDSYSPVDAESKNDEKPAGVALQAAAQLPTALKWKHLVNKAKVSWSDANTSEDEKDKGKEKDSRRPEQLTGTDKVLKNKVHRSAVKWKDLADKAQTLKDSNPGSTTKFVDLVKQLQQMKTGEGSGYSSGHSSGSSKPRSALKKHHLDVEMVHRDSDSRRESSMSESSVTYEQESQQDSQRERQEDNVEL